MCGILYAGHFLKLFVGGGSFLHCIILCMFAWNHCYIRRSVSILMCFDGNIDDSAWHSSGKNGSLMDSIEDQFWSSIGWGFNSDLLWWSIYWNLHLAVWLIQGNNTDFPLFYHARFDFHWYLVGVLYSQVICGWNWGINIDCPLFCLTRFDFLGSNWILFEL